MTRHNGATSRQDDPRVHVSLKSLMHLKRDAQGFSSLPKHAVQNTLTGRHISSMRGRGLNFEEIRQYRQGDDIRTMDWKATNRTGRPHVRAYSDERERPVLIVLDQRRSMFFGSVDKMKSVVAAELAALVTWRVVEVGDRIGALLFNDSQSVDIKPGRHRAKVLQLLKNIEGFNQQLNRVTKSTPESASLNKVLRDAKRLVTHDHLVIVISDMAGWNNDSLKSLSQIAQHNDVIVVQVLDPMERQLPNKSGLIFSDGLLQLDVDANNNKIRNKFSQLQRQNKNLLQSELNKRGIHRFSMVTNVPTIDQLRQAMGMSPAGVKG